MSDFVFGSGVAAIIVGISLIFMLSKCTRISSPYPLPPGPKGEPILGHMRIVPVHNPELYYQKLSREYKSDVLYFKQFRTPVVILNTLKAAEEILSRRGANFIDRPRFVLFEVMGWGLTLTFLPWGARWKAHRALLQKSFTKSNVIQYQGMQEQEARIAIASVIAKPVNYEVPLRRFASAVVLRIGFGVTLTGDDDPYIQIAADANSATAKGGSPGATLVDYFPIFSKFPSWLVRSETLKHARDYRWAIKRLHDVPFAAVKKEFDAGKAETSSYVYPLLEKHAENERQGLPNEFTMADINGSAAAIFIAGSNTTFTTVVVGILNLLINPRVFDKVRAELDRVVGTDRLPSLKDRDNPELRYMECFVEEIIRWRPLSPIGIPHKSIRDDVYDGMFIPKGTNVYYNAWAMSRDENVYKDPDIFNPDRFLPIDEGGNAEPFLQGPFGFGRRICVGRHLAQASVWIVLAVLISTVDIKRVVDPDGKKIDPIVKFSTGLSSHPESFPCDFVPRSKKAEMLIADS